ncbi:MAG: ABC transporter C-terminal domain-containing protein, partial [Pseudomonadota bacterium]|nr:ABC transporter C-terminal domain-containing protein [Pseudomonadota bacterium]
LDRSAALVQPVAAIEPRKHDAQQRQQISARLKALRKELEQADQHMSRLSAEKAVLEQRLSGRLAPADLAADGKRLKSINDELAALEERWLALSGDIESVETTA